MYYVLSYMYMYYTAHLPHPRLLPPLLLGGAFVLPHLAQTINSKVNNAPSIRSQPRSFNSASAATKVEGPRTRLEDYN